MTGFQLHDTDNQEVLGSVIITHSEPEVEDAVKTLHDAWNDFNRLEETDCDPYDVDEFVVWFNENYVTQIERLYLEYIQPFNGDE